MIHVLNRISKIVEYSIHILKIICNEDKFIKEKIKSEHSLIKLKLKTSIKPKIIFYLNNRELLTPQK